ncbi:hypothetical protein RA28_10445 [Ruegeria sp. ANG-S4]|nr:hypothetical protein RA28_10445 [Ruegeria sp. ANG-S4]
MLICLSLLLAGCEDSEERAERHLQSAVELLAAGDTERAIVELRNVVKFDVDHKEGRLLLAQTLAKQGDVQDSISQFLRLAEQYPDFLIVRTALTRMMLEINAWEEAEHHGRFARDLASEDPDVIFLNAVLDYRESLLTGDMSGLTKPSAIARQHVAMSPDNLLAWRLLIDHALAKEDTAEALRRANQALTHLPHVYELHLSKLHVLSERRDVGGIRDALMDMMAQFPQDPQARNMLLSWYLEQRDLEGAEAYLRELAAAPGAAADQNLQVVNFLKRTRGNEAARAEVDRLVANDPEAVEYLAMRAVLDFEDGETASAISRMKQLLDGAEPSENTSNLKVNLARMLVSSRQVQEARSWVDGALTDTPGHVEALKMRAAWQIEDDLPEEAILTLRTAQANAPRDPDIMVLMGQAHERAGARELAGERYALAVEASERAPSESLRYATFLLQDGRFDVAETVLADALKVAPAHVDLIATMAEVQLRNQNWNHVSRLIRQLRAQERPSAVAAADQIETAFLLQQRRTQDALAFLGDLAAADENNTAALADLINTLVQSDNAELAQAILTERMQQDPDNATLKFFRAGLHIIEGEEDLAEAGYRGLLSEDPANFRALRQLSRLLVAQEREEDLTKVIDAAVATQPGSLLPRLLKAEQLERLQDFDGAIELYEGLYADDSGNLIFANNLASLITTHRDDTTSLSRAYTIARRLRGSDVPAFQDTYGWIVFRRGNHSEALDHLKNAAIGLPNNPLVHYHLGEVYLALGRTDDAYRVLNKALTLSANQTFPQLERTREILSTLSATE